MEAAAGTMGSGCADNGANAKQEAESTEGRLPDDNANAEALPSEIPKVSKEVDDNSRSLNRNGLVAVRQY